MIIYLLYEWKKGKDEPSKSSEVKVIPFEKRESAINYITIRTDMSKEKVIKILDEVDYNDGMVDYIDGAFVYHWYIIERELM
jgi:hypothetical protein